MYVKYEKCFSHFIKSTDLYSINNVNYFIAFFYFNSELVFGVICHDFTFIAQSNDSNIFKSYMTNKDCEKTVIRHNLLPALSECVVEFES